MGTTKKNKIINYLLLTLTIIMFISFIAVTSFAYKTSKKESIVEYHERSDLTYSIILNDDSIYTENDKQVPNSNEVKDINVNIRYFNDNNFQNYTLSAYIATYVKSSGVYGVIGSVDTVKSNESVIAKSTNVTYVINYQSYINKLNNYIRAQGIDSNSGKLELVLVANNQVSKSKSKAIVNISVLEDKVTISNVESINNVEETKVSKKSNVLILCAVLLFLATICFALSFYFYYKISKMNEYDRNLYIIFKLNKGILVSGDVKKINHEELIEVSSFKELLKVYNSVSLPIMYTKNAKECEFLIKMGKGGYYFKLKR